MKISRNRMRVAVLGSRKPHITKSLMYGTYVTLDRHVNEDTEFKKKALEFCKKLNDGAEGIE